MYDDEPLDAGAEAPPMQPDAVRAALLQADNIAEILEPAQLGTIAGDAIEEYGIDKASMKDWLERMRKGIDLAKLVRKDKTYPFPNASNVKYPLVTTAALQFNAKAYPAIVPGDDVVKAKVLGSDPTGQKAARGARVAAHMSYQLLCQVDEWEEDTDKLLTVLPIVGTVIRKVWYDPAQKRLRCRLLCTGSFIVNDRVKTLSDAPRLTEELELYPSEIEERIRTKRFIRYDYVTGSDVDRSAPEKFIEQHRRIDLDGDGYAEPYIVTVHVASQAVARIVADFTAADVQHLWVSTTIDPMTGQPNETKGPVSSIRGNSYFVAYHMLPSLDGGFWGTGFGLLLGDVSEAVNSIINLMIDAGHMASRGGGFIGSEFRIKGGSQQFKPGEWKTPAAAGAVIKDAIVPLTFPQPDATLFQMLGLLIEAGKEVASIKDILMGESGGKAMTATTTMALIEQGMAQFTAAYKRIFRSLRHEFKLIARINAETITPEEYNAFHDLPMPLDPRAEYAMADMDIVPVADPASVTKMQRIAKAQMLGEMATNGLVDPAEASKRMLEAASIEDVEALLPKPDPMQQAAAEMQMLAARADISLKLIDVRKKAAEIDKVRADTIATMAGAAATEQETAMNGQAADLGAALQELEVLRAALEGALERSLGGMAGAPGIGGPAAGAPGGPGPAPAGGFGGMVGGPAMVGA